MSKKQENTGLKIIKSNALRTFLVTFFSYLILALASGFVISKAYLRGNPLPLIITYWVALGFNVLLMGLSLLRFIIQKRGYFLKRMKLIETIFLCLWFVAIFAEFLLATLLFDAIRYDVLGIVLCQTCALICLIWWSRVVDYKTNKKNSEPKKDEELSKFIKRREFKKNFQYIIIIILVAVLQVGSALIPKLPPKIDDIFSENRVIKYEKSEVKGENGYYVTDIYYGKNEAVVIPDSYNYLPVLGVKKNAIRDEGIIRSLQIGSYDNNGNLVSHIKTIEEGAINLDLVEKLILPSSLESLGEKAFSGEALKEIVYTSNSSFSMASFDAPKLERLDLQSSEAVNVDYNDLDISVKVPKDLYNDYREKYHKNRKLFEIEDNDIIVVDFETNSDLYLNSQFLDKNNAALNLASLKNDGEETSTFINDTLIYNKNHYAADGFQSKPKHAFRGWFRDNKYSLECTFDATNEVKFSENTTIYAKWNPIKTVELDWNHYFPYNEEKTLINFVSGDDLNESVILPKLQAYGGDVARAGFEGLSWLYNDQKVENTYDLRYAPEEYIRVKADWSLEKPTIEDYTNVNGSHELGYRTITFDEKNMISYEASIDHIAEDLKLNYSWYKLNGEERVLLKEGVAPNHHHFSYDFRNVKDSGKYILRIVAEADTGETRAIERNYNIAINKKDLDQSLFEEMPAVTVTYNGKSQRYDYTQTLPGDIKVTTNYFDEKGNETQVAPKYAKNQPYKVEYIFENYGPERDNYNTTSNRTTIKIVPKPVTAIWKQSGAGWNNTTRVYDGLTHELAPEINGVCGNDRVHFILSEAIESKKNVGNYYTTIIGVDNENYRLSDSIEAEKEWSIVPRPVIGHWDKTSAVYNGAIQSFTLKLDGITSTDVSEINQNSFSYTDTWDASYNSISRSFTFSQRDVNNVNVKIAALNNDNYSFTEISESLSITPRELSTEWTNLDAIYNGKAQSAILTLNGFMDGDEEKYTDAIVKSKFSIISNCSFKIKEKKAGRLVLQFDEQKAGTYPIELNGINGDNYDTPAIKKEFKINPRVIHGQWSASDSTVYNGLNQSFSYIIDNIAEADYESFLREDFTRTGKHNDCKLNKLGGNLELEFIVKDAASDYSARITGFNSDKYNGNYLFIAPEAKSFTVEKKLLELSWSDNEFIYNSLPHEVSATINNLCSGDSCDLSYSNNIKTNASITADYVAKAYALNPNYYTDETTNHSWKILPKKITASILDSEKIYNGVNQEFRVQFSGFEGTADIEAMNELSFNHTGDGEFKSYSIIDNTLIYTFTGKDAKEYKINLTSDSLPNYELEEATEAFRINKKPITASFDFSNPGSKIVKYDGNIKTVSLKLSGFIPTDTINKGAFNTYQSQYTLVNHNDGNVDLSFSYTNAGVYDIAVAQMLNNYTMEEQITSFTIEKKLLEASWTATKEFTYSGQKQGLVLTILGKPANGSPLKDLLNVEVNGINHTVAEDKDSLSFSFMAIDQGIYDINVNTLNVLENYEFAGSTNSFIILPREITYTWDYMGPFIYDDNEHEVNPVFTNLCTREDTGLLDVVVPSLRNNTQRTAGTYTAVLDNVGNKNYVVNQETNSLQYKINQRVIDLSWSTQSFTYNGYQQFKVATISNLCPGDLVSLSYGYEKLNSFGSYETILITADKGSYRATVSSIDGNDSSNYVLPTENLSATYEIASKKLTLTLDKYDIVYNGSVHYGAIGKLDGFVIREDADKLTPQAIEGSHNGTELTTNVLNYSSVQFKYQAINNGTYIVNVDGLANENYVIDSASVEFTISKRPISISWNTDSFIYDGNNRSFSASITNKCLGDNPIINYEIDGSTFEAVERVNAGTYSLKIVGVSDENYTIDGIDSLVLSHSFTINRKPITLSITNPALIYNGNYQGMKLKINGIIAKDNTLFEANPLSFTHDGAQVIYDNNEHCLYLNAVNYGTYNVTVGALNSSFDESNYNLSENSVIDGSYSIGKARISVDWSNPNLVYNAQVQGVVAKINSEIYRNVLNANELDDVVISYEGNTGIDANSYSARMIGLNNDNYELPTNVIKQWRIDKKQLVLAYTGFNALESGTGFETTYDGSYHGVKLTINGFEGTDLEQLNSGDFTLSQGSMLNASLNKSAAKAEILFKQINAGSYRYVLSSITNQNYRLQSVTGSLTINRRIADLRWTSGDYTYDGLAHSVSCEVTNGVARADGTEDALELVLENNVNTRARRYKATVVEIPSHNYELPVARDLEWEIKPRALTITWSDTPAVQYDGLNHPVIATISGIQNNEAPSILNQLQTSELDALREQRVEDGIVTVSFKNINAGTKTFAIEGVSNSDYILNRETKEATINQKDLTIEFRGANSIYNAENQTYTAVIKGFEATDASMVESYQFTLSMSDGTRSYSPVLTRQDNQVTFSFTVRNAGEYNLKVNGYTNNNYRLQALNNTKSYTISPKEVVLTIGDKRSFTYNALEQCVAVDYNGVYNADFDYVANSVVISGAKRFSYTNDGSLLTASIYGLNAGEYNINIDALGVKNYTITSKAFTFKINPKELNVALELPDGASITYDALAHNVITRISGFVGNKSYESGDFTATGGFTKSAILDGEMTLKYEFSNSGVHNVSFSGIRDANYKVAPKSAALTINKANLVASISTPEGQTTTYDGLAKTAIITISGFKAEADAKASRVLGLALEYSPLSKYEAGILTIKYSFTNAGIYTLGLDGYNDDNYNTKVEAKATTITINKKLLTVAMLPEDNPTYNGLKHYITVRISGIPMAGDSINPKFTAVGLAYEKVESTMPVYERKLSAIDAGAYSLGISNTTDNNYIYSHETVTMNINKKKLASIASGDYNQVYDGLEHTFEVKYSGFENHDEDDINILSHNGAATAIHDAGSGYIVIRWSNTNTCNLVAEAWACSNDNYEFTPISQKLSITRAKLSVDIDKSNFDIAYDGLEHVYTLKVLGFKGNDSQSINWSSSTEEITKNEKDVVFTWRRTSAGATPINVKLLNSRNYEFDEFRAIALINNAKANISIAEASSYVYSGKPKSVVITISNLNVLNLNLLPITSNADEVDYTKNSIILTWNLLNAKAYSLIFEARYENYEQISINELREVTPLKVELNLVKLAQNQVEFINSTTKEIVLIPEGSYEILYFEDEAMQKPIDSVDLQKGAYYKLVRLSSNYSIDITNGHIAGGNA